jgi:hypothetical protein
MDLPFLKRRQILRIRIIRPGQAVTCNQREQVTFFYEKTSWKGKKSNSLNGLELMNNEMVCLYPLEFW